MPIEVQGHELKRLGAAQLQGVVNRLLLAEARTHGIPLREVQGTNPTRINVSDGGQDASIDWEGGPEQTEFVPKRNAVLQLKAQNVNKSDLKGEVKTRDGDLKPAIRDVLSASGAYIVVSTFTYEGNHQTKRLDAIKEGIAETGFTVPDDAIVKFYDGEKLANWINQYPPVARWVIGELALQAPVSVKTWTEWSYADDLREHQFESDESMELKLKQIRLLASESKKAVRVTGLSGLGKTRLVFEAFRNSDPTDLERDAMQTLVLYFGNTTERRERALEVASQLAESQSRSILIADDCPADIHNKIHDEIKRAGSQASLISIDHQFGAHTQPNEVRLDRLADDTIKRILRQSHGDLPATILGRLAEFAQGFPRIAALLADAHIARDPTIGVLQDDELLKKILWGRSPESDDDYKVIQICSLFSSLGIAGEVSGQLDYAAQLASVTSNDFYGRVVGFEERQLIQRRNRYVQVQPRPVALRLAADWWARQQPQRIRQIFEEAPPDLLSTMCEQMQYLDSLPTARDVVSDLCGYDGPFGSAEVLNTKHGSRCFRSLVEVNPSAAMGAIKRSFGQMSIADLRAVGPGRRDLVWSLEKIVFHDDLFEDAARLLMRFGAAENETWGNNATGQFKQLYQLILAGTEAGMEKRFRVLDEGLRSDIAELRDIAVDAIDSSIRTHGFTRSGGAEKQGAATVLQDWRPRTQEDAREYFREALKRIVWVAENLPDHRSVVLRHFTTSVRGLVGVGLVAEVAEVADQLAEFAPEPWVELIASLAEVETYDFEDATPETREKIHELYEQFFPTSLLDRVKLLVSDLPFVLQFQFGSAEGAGRRQNVGEDNARDLARDLAAEPSSIEAAIPFLVSGRQEEGYAFGHELGLSLIGTDASKSFVQISISGLEGAEHPNAVVLAGFLSALGHEDPLVESALEHLETSEKLRPHLIPVMRLLPDLSADDLERILLLIRGGSIDVSQLRSLAWGRVVDQMPMEEFVQFLGNLLEIEVEEAPWVALDLARAYAYQRPERRDALLPIYRRITMTPGILKTIGKTHGQLDAHHYAEVVEELINDATHRDDVLHHVLAEIVRVVSEDRGSIMNADHAIRDILGAAFDVAPIEAWRSIGQAFAEGHRLSSISLEYVLGHGQNSEPFDPGADENGARRSRRSFVGSVPAEELLAWCRQNPDLGPVFVLRTVPMLQRTDLGVIVNPLIVKIVEEFGSDEAVVDSATAQVFHFGWTGSLAEYYEQFEAPFQRLAEEYPSGPVADWARRVRETARSHAEEERALDSERDFGHWN